MSIVVYLIHFNTPYQSKNKACQHYLGSTVDLKTRMQAHRSGNGAKLLMYCNLKGITYEVARTWEVAYHLDARRLEISLKKGHHLKRYCPVCLAKGGS